MVYNLIVFIEVSIKKRRKQGGDGNVVELRLKALIKKSIIARIHRKNLDYGLLRPDLKTPTGSLEILIIILVSFKTTEFLTKTLPAIAPYTFLASLRCFSIPPIIQ